METHEHEARHKSKVNRYGLGPRTPSADLPFPSCANFTAYELLAFLPNVLHCADVIYRFISNGGTRHAIWVIINTARDFPAEWHANCCGNYMYKAMHQAGFNGWTITMHDNWHAARKAAWNETILDVGDFRTPSQVLGRGISVGSIPFTSLAVDVRRMPQGDDALDLTRMVQYCIQHSQEKWMYPRDCEKLLHQLGGPAPIRPGHLDRKVFGRWETKAPPPHRTWTTEEIDFANSFAEMKKRGRRDGSARLGTLESGGQSRKATPTEAQRKTRGRLMKRARLEELDMDEEKMKNEDEVLLIESYKRTPAVYVAPPRDAKAPSATTIIPAFTAEGVVSEADSSSAYAFGGPRRMPPYRMLHHIEEPDPADISGWAENLRWAFEQRACFWHAVQTEGWNESPAHMELIAKTRQEQDWASDELLEHLPDVEEEEPDDMGDKTFILDNN